MVQQEKPRIDDKSKMLDELSNRIRQGENSTIGEKPASETVDWPACISYINSYVKENFAQKTPYAMLLEIYASPTVIKLRDTNSEWLVDVHIAQALRHNIAQNRNEVIAFLNSGSTEDF